MGESVSYGKRLACVEVQLNENYKTLIINA